MRLEISTVVRLNWPDGTSEACAEHQFLLTDQSSGAGIPVALPALPAGAVLMLEVDAVRRMESASPDVKVPHHRHIDMEEAIGGHHHHPIDSLPCVSQHVDPEQRHIYVAVWTEPDGMYRHAHIYDLDSAHQLAEAHGGVLAALPIVADFRDYPLEPVDAPTGRTEAARGIPDWPMDQTAHFAATDPGITLPAAAQLDQGSVTMTDDEQRRMGQAAGFLRQGGYHEHADALEALCRAGKVAREFLRDLDGPPGFRSGESRGSWFAVSDDAVRMEVDFTQRPFSGLADHIEQRVLAAQSAVGHREDFPASRGGDNGAAPDVP